MANEYSDTSKEVGENIKNILSEEQLLKMENNGTVPPNEEFFTPEDDIDRDKAMILNWIYPVGIILQFAEEVDPNALMPGQRWKKIEGKFLLASDSNYSLGVTGGEATHTLTIDEMPNHYHSYGEPRHTGGDWSCLGSPCDMNTSLDQNNTMVFHGYTFSTGGSQAHNNMPPYLVVNVWKRTA